MPRGEPVPDQIGQHANAEPMAEERRSGAALLPCVGEQFECTPLFRAELTFLMQGTHRTWLTDRLPSCKRAYRPGAQLRCNRIPIHLAFGDLRQLNISLLFLFEALMQKPLVITQVQLPGQSRDHAISSDLVMLDLLC